MERWSDIKNKYANECVIDKIKHQRIEFHTLPPIKDTQTPIENCNFLWTKYSQRYHEDKWENIARFYQPQFLFAQQAKFEYDRIFQTESSKEYKYVSDGETSKPVVAKEDQSALEKKFEESFDDSLIKRKVISNYVTNPLGVAVLVFNYETLPNGAIIQQEAKIEFINHLDIQFIAYDAFRTKIVKFGYSLGLHKKVFIDEKAQYVYKDDILVEIPFEHNLGYCPAVHITENIQDVPLISALDSLDMYCELAMVRHFADLDISVPKQWHYKISCNYYDTSYQCVNGYLIDLQDNRLGECPSCSKNKKMFSSLGGAFEIETPDFKQGEQQILPIAGYIEQSGKYHEVLKDLLLDLEKKILSILTGHSASLLQEEAVNESQIKSSFEERIAVLNVVRRDLIRVYEFLINSCARFFSNGKIKEVDIEFSYEYFQDSAEAKLAKIKQAKDAGMSKTIINSLEDEYLEFVGETEDIEKDELLSELFPFIDLPLAECITLYNIKVLSDYDLFIRVNHKNLLEKFEAQNDLSILRIYENDGFLVLEKQFNDFSRSIFNSKQPQNS